MRIDILWIFIYIYILPDLFPLMQLECLLQVFRNAWCDHSVLCTSHDYSVVLVSLIVAFLYQISIRGTNNILVNLVNYGSEYTSLWSLIL